MSDDVFSYIRYVLEARRKLLLLIIVGAMPFVLIFVRMIKVPFSAQVKVFAFTPGSDSLNALSYGSGASQSREQRIASQEAILSSIPIFERFRKEVPWPPNQGEDSSRPLTSFRFAHDLIFKYAQPFLNVNAKKQKLPGNPDFDSFKGAVSLSPHFREGTFDIVFSHPDPYMALKGVEVLSRVLIKYNQEMAISKIDSASTYLKARINETRQQMEVAGRKLTQFLQTAEFSGDQSAISARYEQYLKQLNTVEETRAKIAALRVAIHQLKRIESELKEKMESTMQNLTLARIEAIIKEIQRIEELGFVTGPESQNDFRRTTAPTLKILNDKLRSLSSKVVRDDRILSADDLRDLLIKIKDQISQRESELYERQTFLETYRDTIVSVDKKLNELPNVRLQFNKLNSDYENLSKRYYELSNEYYKSFLRNSFEGPELVILETAALRKNGIAAHKSKVVFILMVVVCLAALFLLALFDKVRGSILSKDQLRGYESASYLGAIPRAALFQGEASRSMMITNTVSRIAYTLRNKMRARSTEEQRAPYVINITEMSESDEAEDTIVMLALNLQKQGAKVAILDCKSAVAQNRMFEKYGSKLFGQRFWILSNYLIAVGNRDPLRREAYPTAFRLFDHEKFHQGLVSQSFVRKVPKQITKLIEHFDIIFVDGPPLQYGEARVIIENSDCTVFCATERKGTLKDIEAAMSVIDTHRKVNSDAFIIITDSVNKYNYTNITSLRSAPQEDKPALVA